MAKSKGAAGQVRATPKSADQPSVRRDREPSWTAGLAAARGVPQAKSNQCLSNQKMIDHQVQVTSDVNSQYPDFPGTPAFIINGKLLPKGGHDLGQAPAVTRWGGEFVSDGSALAAGLGSVLILADRGRKASRRSSGVHNWSHIFAVTPDGGFRHRQPGAKVAIVEYLFLDLPALSAPCAEAMKPLMDQDIVVPEGQGSAFRPFVLNGIDLAATLMARCAGPRTFSPIAEQLYATQPVWIGREWKTCPRMSRTGSARFPTISCCLRLPGAPAFFRSPRRMEFRSPEGRPVSTRAPRTAS